MYNAALSQINLPERFKVSAYHKWINTIFKGRNWKRRADNDELLQRQRETDISGSAWKRNYMHNSRVHVGTITFAEAQLHSAIKRGACTRDRAISGWIVTCSADVNRFLVLGWQTYPAGMANPSRFSYLPRSDHTVDSSTYLARPRSLGSLILRIEACRRQPAVVICVYLINVTTTLSGAWHACYLRSANAGRVGRRG